MITRSVRPESWTANGGECVINLFPQNLSIVVSQTAKGHDAVAALVAGLRAKMDKQIVLNFRGVSDPGELFRLMKCDVAATKNSGIAILQPEIVAQAHTLTEAKHGANVKLTVFNGQRLKLQAADSTRGTQRSVIVQALCSQEDGSTRLRLADSTESQRQPWSVDEMTILECGSILVDATMFPFPAEWGLASAAPNDGEKHRPSYVLVHSAHDRRFRRAKQQPWWLRPASWTRKRSS